MLRRFYLASCFGLAGGTAALGCINDHKAEPRPVVIQQIKIDPPPSLKIDPAAVLTPPAQFAFSAASLVGANDPQRAAYQKTVLEYELAPAQHASHADRTHYAVALIFLGRVSDAIVELQLIEKAFPGRYENATNLGTAYELASNLTDARRWILEAIRRNPQAHDGTEWLHVAILEAKLALLDDPDWFKTHRVLEAHTKRSDAEVLHAIVHQLNERLNFVAAPDPSVSDLFFEAAKRTTDPKARAEFAARSKQFGNVRRAELAKL